MSKARKRLIFRMSIVTVIMGVGVFALVLSQMSDTRADQTGTQNKGEIHPGTRLTVPPSARRTQGGTVDRLQVPKSAPRPTPVKQQPTTGSRGDFRPSELPEPTRTPLPEPTRFKSADATQIQAQQNAQRNTRQSEQITSQFKAEQRGGSGVSGQIRDGVSNASSNTLGEARGVEMHDDEHNQLTLAAPENALDASSLGAPGAQHLEGLRTPSLALEKRAPEEIQVGKPALFELHVQNVGRVDANNVMVLDQVPRGTRFVDASPMPQQTPDGQLLWQLGTLKPADEKTISIQLIPVEEGEIGSVARVAFETEASVKTICTRPQLAVEVTTAQRVLIGENIKYTVKVSNPGTGDATGVILEEDVPEGFSHPAGKQLEFEIGTLRPGESREVKLTLKAEAAGKWDNVMLVRGEGNLVEQDTAVVEVIAPSLNLATRGPSKRYLERPATYNIEVQNPGTAPANDIELVAFLHKGMKFVETNNQGQYDPQQHAVYWSLDQLPAREQGAVQLTVLPIDTGEQRLRIEGRGELGVKDAEDHLLQVEGLAALEFDVADAADPIEVGSDTVYQVRVVNQGSKTATNITVAAAVPAGMQPIGGDGPTRHQIEGQVIQFAPLTRLAPKGEAVFKIQVRGLQEGDQRIRVQLASDDSTAPITKEESTRVYLDR